MVQLEGSELGKDGRGRGRTVHTEGVGGTTAGAMLGSELIPSVVSAHQRTSS